MAAQSVARGNKISMCASSRPDKQVKNSSEEIPHCLSFQKSQCLNFLRAFLSPYCFRACRNTLPIAYAYCFAQLKQGTCLIRLKEDFSHIIEHYKNHQKQKEHQPCKVNFCLQLRLDALFPNRLHNQKYKSSSVQCRNWPKIHNTKVC